MEECTEESSVGYQISGNENYDDTGTGEIKGIIITSNKTDSFIF